MINDRMKKPDVIQNPSNPFQQQIKDLFSKRDLTELEFIFKIVDLIIYQSMYHSDLFELYSCLDLENFSKVVNVVDGRSINLPKKEELEDALVTALIYYEREIKNLEWKDIKAKYSEIDISSLKYSHKINMLDNFVKQKISELFQKELDHGK